MQYNLTTIQVVLKNQKGKVLTVNKRFSEKDLKAYKDEIRKQCESVGLSVGEICFGYNDLPEGQQITPITLQTEKKKEPEPVKDEKVDIHDLPQYRGKPKIKSKKS